MLPAGAPAGMPESVGRLKWVHRRIETVVVLDELPIT
jgi:hypothetical protein